MAKARKKGELKLVEADSLAAPDALLDGHEKIENWASDTESDVYVDAGKFYRHVQKCYDNQDSLSQNISEYWDIYNAIPDENLQYSGNSQGYVPVVRDALKARTKRTLKQLFPANDKHVEGYSAEGNVPFTQMALLEHYIRKTKLKDVVRADLTAGDVTGQWNLYIDWCKSYRRITDLVKQNPILELDGQQSELDDDSGDEDTESREVIIEGPEVVAFATEDLAVYPPTVDDLEKAEAVSIRLRMSFEKVEQMIDEGVFIMPGNSDDQEVKDFITGLQDQSKGIEKRSPTKKMVQDAGIRTEGTYKYVLVYEVHCKLDFGEGYKERAIVFFAGAKVLLGIIRAPWWGGKLPILSAPVDKITGSFFGRSKIDPVKFLQWQLVDFWNMGQDSAMYSMLPIVMTDPLKQPNWASMVIGLAAVWAVDPNSTRFAEFPQLWKEAAEKCTHIKQQIWESLEVNEMMMGGAPKGRKNNQAVGAMQQEQSISITDHGERYEEEMLNPLIERMFEYDQQFRTKELTIEARGEIGALAALEVIPPQQWGERFSFRWCGTSYMASVQRIQQQIAAVNVLRGIPPQLLGGRRLDLGPVAQAIVEQAFGPELGPKILIDDRNMLTVPVDVENEILHNGMPCMVHGADNDMEHIQSHIEAAKKTGDPQGLSKQHIGLHVKQLQQKQEKAMAQQHPPGGQQGMPGGSGPGVAGTPRIGAQPQGNMGQQVNPPGAVHPDSMIGAPGRG